MPSETKLLNDAERKELGAKLKQAKKNAHVSQQKVRELTSFVDRLKTNKEKSLESLAAKKRALEEKDKEIAKLDDMYDKTTTRLKERKELSSRLKKEIRNAEMLFMRNIKSIKSINTKAEYENKEATTNYTSKNLAADRGYDCKPGSTHGHISSTVKRSFFPKAKAK